MSYKDVLLRSSKIVPEPVTKMSLSEHIKNSIFNKPKNIQDVVDDENDIKKPNTVSKEISKMIVDARVIQGLTRADLAKKLEVKVCIIDDIETGKAIYNGDFIAKVKKCLGIEKTRKL